MGEENKPADKGTPAPADDKKPADNKPADAVKPAAEDKKPSDGQTPPATPDDTQKIVPDEYELSVPENSLLSSARVEKLQQYAKEKGLSKDDAQALLNREHDALSGYVNDQHQSLKKLSDQWVNESMSDKELGGEKFKETVEIAKRGLELFFGNDAEPIKEFMEKTGYGNRLPIIRAFYKYGKQHQNDKVITPSTTTPKSADRLSRIYDNPTSKQT